VSNGWSQEINDLTPLQTVTLRLRCVPAPRPASGGQLAADLIIPPELRILERQVSRVNNGRAIVIPTSAETIGHGTNTKAAVWEQHLGALLRQTERQADPSSLGVGR
jgi:hypothetical protein